VKDAPRRETQAVASLDPAFVVAVGTPWPRKSKKAKLRGAQRLQQGDALPNTCVEVEEVQHGQRVRNACDDLQTANSVL
jgi:hypothetical protein